MHCVTRRPVKAAWTVTPRPPARLRRHANRLEAGRLRGFAPHRDDSVRRHREVPLAPRQDEPDDEAPQPQRDTARKHLLLADGGREANHPTAAVNLAALVEIRATNRGTEGGTTTDRLSGSTPITRATEPQAAEPRVWLPG